MSESEKESLEKLGEFGLIERIKSNFPISKGSSIKGIGDDAAILDAAGRKQVVSSDLLAEGIHFDLSYMPLKHLGFKSVAVNVSDIAAMNAIPEQILINIALSNRFDLDAIDELYKGIAAGCEAYGVDLVGGDTTSSRSGLIISVTAIGYAKDETIVQRSGAKLNDIICCTGDLGAAYLGLQVLEREKQVFKANPQMQPELENFEYLVKRQLKPVARLDIIHELAELGIVPTAMIDISDGLASECLHLAKESGLGMRIYEENIPIDNMTFETAVEFNLDPMTCAMNGGEDYELLFTVDPKDHPKLEKHPDIHFLGHVVEKSEGSGFVTKNGNHHPLKAQGWRHF